MRQVRRLVAILIGCAAWCMAATTVAYAQLPDPGGGPIVPPATTDMPVWQLVVTAALGLVLVAAVIGLIFSLRHTRTSQPSRRSEPTTTSHA